MENILDVNVTQNGSTQAIHLVDFFDISISGTGGADGTVTLERTFRDPSQVTPNWQAVKAYNSNTEETGFSASKSAWYRLTVASQTTGTWRLILTDGRTVNV